MPNLASAKKNLRKSEKRRKARSKSLDSIKRLLKIKDPDKRRLQSLIDKAAKRHLLPRNKAKRLKAQLTRLAS